MSAILRTPVTDASAWRPSDLGGCEDWAYVLDHSQVEEIERCVAQWKSREWRIADLHPERIDLPRIAPTMERVRRDVLEGRGFAVVRGLPVQRLSERDAALAFWALGTFLGQGVSQSTAGELLGRVYDRAERRVGYRLGRGYQSNARLTMHCDLADLVGLLCFRRARHGGDSFLASCATIYNIILAEHPKYLEPLYRGFYWSRNDEQDPGELPHSEDRIPAFLWEGGRLSARFNRTLIERGTQAAEGDLTPLAREAIEFVSDVAWRDDVAFKQTMEPGDVLFLNNYLVLHSRDAFEDWPEPERQRLLFRLWLRTPGARNFGQRAAAMEELPLKYGNQGRTAEELASRQIGQLF